MNLPLGLPDWLALLEARHPNAIRLGLERVARVWAALGAEVAAGRASPSAAAAEVLAQLD